MREHLGMRRARLALAAISIAIPAIASAATWVVDPNGPLPTIQGAIDQAQPGDIVLVQPGTYYELLVLRDGVSLEAQTSGSVIVDAEAEGIALVAEGIGAATTVTGIVFEHGSSQAGGGLFGEAVDALFTECAFVDNSAAIGGGLYLKNGSRARFIDCDFSRNSASVGGGIYLDFSSIQISSSTIDGNVARDGAALAANNASEATVSYVSFYDNTATTGTVIACNLASPRFTNCTVASNTSSLGAFGFRGSGSRVENSIVSFNGGPAMVCDGFNGLWIGCSIVWGNTTNTICDGDQGTNLFVDPRFCNPVDNNFKLAADSPEAVSSCGLIGAEPVACPAQGVETALRSVTWSNLKSLYGH